VRVFVFLDFVVAFNSQLAQILVCNDTALNCPNIYNETSTSTVYVTQPEAFTVLVDHSVLAQSFDLQVPQFLFLSNPTF
jgi:hypothetical protein